MKPLQYLGNIHNTLFSSSISQRVSVSPRQAFPAQCYKTIQLIGQILQLVVHCSSKVSTDIVPNQFPKVLIEILSSIRHDIQHNDIQHNNTQHYSKLNTTLRITTLSIMLLCHYAECHLCKVLSMLSVANKPIMLRFVMLNVVVPSGPPYLTQL